VNQKKRKASELPLEENEDEEEGDEDEDDEPQRPKTKKVKQEGNNPAHSSVLLFTCG